MSTEQAIRQREAGNSTETPASDNDGGGPLPSLSRTHIAIIAVVVALGVAYYLYSRDSSGGSGGSGGSLDSAREEMDGTTEASIEGDDEDDDGKIVIENDPGNPLAGDAVVIKEFRDRGILSPEDD